jgi:hypothetical protein
MSAESTYFFRHALLRDAAYQLQLPGDRASLHALALEAMEGLSGGPPPAPPPLTDPVLPRILMRDSCRKAGVEPFESDPVR